MGRGQGWIGRLRSSLGNLDVVLDAEDEVDGLLPSVAVYPSTVEEVSHVLTFAWEEALAITPKGGGTALHLGNRPRRLDILLCLSALKGGFEHSPEDMVATVPAGMTVGETNEMLADREQCLPLDPPRPDEATVGGVLAAGSLGPRMQWFGPLRDSVLGLRVVLPDGRVVKTGGRVVKNVAGYDMAKLYVGSLGTLGIIVEVAFKLRPLFKVTTSLLFPFPTLDGAVRTSYDLLEAGLQPLALTVLNSSAASALNLGTGAACLLVEFGDLKQVVERQVREAEGAARVRGSEDSLIYHGEESRKLWQSVRDAPVSPWDVTFRGSVPLAEVDAFLDATEETLKSRGMECCLVAHTGLGIVFVSPLSRPMDETIESIYADLTALCTSLGGNLVLERAPADLKDTLDVWGPRPPGFDLMSRVKAEFDPKGILNPGRFVGGL